MELESNQVRNQSVNIIVTLTPNSPTLNHSMDLTKYRASRYLARLPIHIAESGSLSLCTPYFLWLPSDPAVGQQRPCHSDCLPLSQGDSGFFQPDGFASFAGQTKCRAFEMSAAFLYLLRKTHQLNQFLHVTNALQPKQFSDAFAR